MKKLHFQLSGEFFEALRVEWRNFLSLGHGEEMNILMNNPSSADRTHKRHVTVTLFCFYIFFKIIFLLEHEINPLVNT